MKRFSRSAGLAGAVAVALAAAAPAVAAPDRSFEFGTEAGTNTWNSLPNVGVAPIAQVAAAVGCDVRNCDDTLVKIGERGKLVVDAIADQPTLVDADLYIFESDASGTPGAQLVADTRFDATDGAPTASVQRRPAGYYLIRVDWAFGAGSYTGKVAYTPQPLTTP